jgi:hypothetical protein
MKKDEKTETQTEKKEGNENNVDNVKKTLEAQLKKWESISQKIAHREKFIFNLDRLSQFSTSLKSEKEKNNFETEAFFLRLTSKVNYREDEGISISNVELISEFITFISAKIKSKIAALEIEILG